ncbi:type VI secretion system-associated FHA domain protein TagH [Thiocapsa bogorovii]|uniref:type VI secretion system-associated FHA domain protein TagH n=1 Tax=Thiocapsa bogorovii TaxID=521689 RepID=UPI001E613E2F|nr:type VI secretion system-associated FHA domain protein TagH [Thiocapsa bogorovii]UHD16094.1 type VI secretion system-associated FHA domain protein TagH [Thiocapsa bogorovii]
MGLVVTVTAYNGFPPQHPVSARSTDQTLVLGRHPDCQVELRDPECLVSGRHALIAPLGDGFAITDISTNGTFLNDAPEPIPANQPVILNDGDRLAIGPYLLRVALESSDASPVADPFAVSASPIPSTPDARSEKGALPGFPESSATPDIMDLLDPGSSAIQGGASHTDAANGLGFPGSGGAPSMSNQPGERAVLSAGNEGPRPSVEHMHLGVPTTGSAVHPTGASAGHGGSPSAAGAPVDKDDTHPQIGIPDDYDLLSDAFIPDDDDGSPAAEQRNAYCSDQRDESVAASPDSAQAVASAPEIDAPQVLQINRGTVETNGAEAGEETALFAPAGVAAGAALPIEDSRRRQAKIPAETPAYVPGASAELNAFLAGLGAGDAEAIPDPEALMQTSGQLLRAATEGMIAVMMARASFKSELRLEVTTIRSRENNPFQFCVDADDAIDRLLLRRGRGFLDPATAVHKTFDDIQAHQMAMIAGLRAALKALLARFEPERLEKHFDGESHLDKLLPMARKSKCWDLFVSTFDQVAEDGSEDFMRLFGDAFNRAYEEQIKRLTNAKRRDSG